jgi:hypothetical protein
MDELNQLLKCVNAQQADVEQSSPERHAYEHKRSHLKNLIKQGQSLPGKTTWTIDRLDKASDKVIDKLYRATDKPTGKPNKTAPVKQKDLLSKFSGVDNFQTMMGDINSSFLIKNSASEMMGKLAPSIDVSSMEVLGSHVYERYGIYMAPVSLFCTIFNHLDWESFARMAKERRAAEDVKDDVTLPEINGAT